MKVIFLFFVFIACWLAISVNGQTCAVYTSGCVGLGQTCTPRSLCTGCTNLCAANYACVNTTAGFQCVSRVEGSTCVVGQPNQCSRENYPASVEYSQICSSGLCVSSTSLSGGRMPRDPCTMNSQCLSANCTGGICAGAGSGFACVTSDDCNPGLSCPKGGGVCSTAIPNNGTCDKDRDCAVFTNECLQPVSVTLCVDIGLVPVGSPCSVNRQCSSGATCVGGVCVLPTGTSSGVSCEGFNLPNGNCTNNFESCSCNVNSGTFSCQQYQCTTPTSCSPSKLSVCMSEYRALMTCLQTSGCHRDSEVKKYGTCAANSCSTQSVTYELCVAIAGAPGVSSTCRFQSSTASSTTTVATSSVLPSSSPAVSLLAHSTLLM